MFSSDLRGPLWKVHSYSPPQGVVTYRLRTSGLGQGNEERRKETHRSALILGDLSGLTLHPSPDTGPHIPAWRLRGLGMSGVEGGMVPLTENPRRDDDF